MKYYIGTGIVIVILALNGCGKVSPPMDKAQIVNILQDVHIAEALINGHHPVMIKDSLEKRYLAQVLEKWNATPEEFEAAMNQMHGDPDYMKEVYDALKLQVNEYSESLDEKEDEEKEKEIEKPAIPEF